MAARQAGLDRKPESAAHLSARFEPRDHRAASRQEALRLARDARALPRHDRWLYLRALRSAARRSGLAGLEGLKLDRPAVLGEPLDRSAAGDGRGRDVPVVEAASRSAAWTSRRVLPAFALTGLVVGIAAAVLLPASLSERLPGTSGNDREPLAAEPSPAREPLAAQSNAPAANGPGQTAGAGAKPPRRPRGRRDSHLSGGGLSGEGSGRIGTLHVDRPMKLRWRSDRGFAIVSEDWRFRPRALSGSTVLTPGTYRRFAVRSPGSWTLKLVPTG